MAKNISIKMSTMAKTRRGMDDEDATTQRKQTRQPLQKIGNDRNHSGVPGAQFAPPPARPKPEVAGRDAFLPFFPSRNVTNFCFLRFNVESEVIEMRR